MLNTLLRLKAGSLRKPDLMRFFSPIWIHICACGFSTEASLSCSAGLTESPALGRADTQCSLFLCTETARDASCNIVNELGPVRARNNGNLENMEVSFRWVKKKSLTQTNKNPKQ